MLLLMLLVVLEVYELLNFSVHNNMHA